MLLKQKNFLFKLNIYVSPEKETDASIKIRLIQLLMIVKIG